MIPKKAFYKAGQFVDYECRVHKFVICAALVSMEDYEMRLCTVDADGVKLLEDHGLDDDRILESCFIGIAVCSPRDEFDEALGKKMALGRALCGRLRQRWIASDVAGMINADMIEAMLNGLANSIVANPGMVIPGYHSSAKKHAQRKLAASAFSKLTDNEKAIVCAAKNGTDLVRLQALADSLRSAVPSSAPPEEG